MASSHSEPVRTKHTYQAAPHGKELVSLLLSKQRQRSRSVLPSFPAGSAQAGPINEHECMDMKVCDLPAFVCASEINDRSVQINSFDI
ncbi:hypothetical protein PISMIDRAFT_292777 [Pisolithus microcarpus 441]|uniref:Uncharacterized protein n=1 Tax=Pisolithus microcarpus 441 TaxID=765257 RepID=A0A0C9XTG7_9AGAM|nr:hypothetical protein PISMIDRAFT_292777 [Pisolithus microcarpus 441]